MVLSHKLQCSDSAVNLLMNTLYVNCTLLNKTLPSTCWYFFLCVGLMKSTGFDAPKVPYACFVRLLSANSCIITSEPSLNLIEIIQCQYFLLCQFKIRLFYSNLLSLKLVHTGFHTSVSMGSLFSSWQRDKCCIVRFLSLDGLGRFVFWTRGRMPALSSLGLLISPVQSTPPGKLL